MITFAVALQIPPDLVDLGFTAPVRELWERAVAKDLDEAVGQSLAQLGERWMLAVSCDGMVRGDQPGEWRLSWTFIAIDPDIDTLPIPAEARRWAFHGPIRRKDNAI